jgi:(p)ppGpp synthase/HD superfamily hydrolase
MFSETELAQMLCVYAHDRQFRRDGVTPYHTHPCAVADAVPDELKPAAYLHDVLEDTKCTIENLRAFGFSDRTLAAVVALTRRGEPYDVYMEGLLKNQDAIRIKIADMEHNLSCQPSENSKQKIARWLPVLKEANGRR